MDQKISLYEEPSRAGGLMKNIILLVIIAAVACAAAYAVVSFGVEKVRMPGRSMEETFSDGDLLLVNRAAYRFGEPDRGDIIVFQMADTGVYSVKRVVAVPGDRVKISEGVLYVNGEAYKETSKVAPMKTAGTASSELLLEDGAYFVLGDNRESSEDSRFASVGCVRPEQIVGKVWLRLSPSFGIAGRLNPADGGESETKETNGK